MRNLILIVLAFCTVCFDGAFCATARGRAVQQNNKTQSTTTARAAVNSRTAPRATTGARTTAARSAKPTKTPTVSARAATAQKVIGSGAKVDAAAQNTVVDTDCQNLYNACMDAFCVNDNIDGGRCVCSDKYSTFNKYFNEIDDLNLQAYKLQTVGVEKIESVVSKNPGLQFENASSVLKKEIQDVLKNGEFGSALKKTAHDACVKQIPQCKDKMTILSGMYSGQINGDCIAYENSLKKQKADAKQRLTNVERGLQEIALDSAKNANKYDLGQCTIKFRECMKGPDVCNADFTGCVDTVEMARSRVKNTQGEEFFTIPGSTAGMVISKSMHETLLAKSVICAPVLENCVKVRDSVFNSFLADSAVSLQMAENLAEYNARTDCIKSVSDCFHNACRDNIDPNDPDASYDACLTRPEMMLTMCKPQLDICGVDATDGASARKSQIWEFVLARLAGMKVDACTKDLKDCLADENRCGPDYTQCVGLSTEQIIKMCPYDKLLGCKNTYGEEITSNEVYEKLYSTVQGIILNIDNAMLATCQAAVDAAAYRACGPDLDCAGLVDLENLGTTSLDYKICEFQIVGEDVAFTDNCHRSIGTIPDVDLGRVENSASGQLGPVVSYAGIIDVPIYWEMISVGADGRFVGLDDYVKKLEEDERLFLTDLQKERLSGALYQLRDGMKNVMEIIELDPTVKSCMTGRSINGVWAEKVGRFPNITHSTGMIIAQKMLQRTKMNYWKKYAEFQEQQLKDYTLMVARQAEIRDENAKDARRETARQSCVSLAEMSAMPKTKEPPSGVLGGILIGVILAAVTVATCVLTFGGGAVAIGAVANATVASSSGISTGVGLGAVAAGTTVATTAGGVSTTMVSIGGAMAAVAGTGLTAATASAGIAGIVAGTVGGAALVATAGLAINDAVQGKDVYIKSSESTGTTQDAVYTGSHSVKHWNYKEDITTIFDPIKMTCEKCVISTECKKTKAPMFGDQYCKEWEKSSQKKCSTIQF